jgi:hypothetical protein
MAAQRNPVEGWNQTLAWRKFMYLLDPRLALLVPLVAIGSLACGTPAAKGSSSATASALTAPLPSLGTAGSYTILAGTAVTCTGTTITGNVGVAPGTSITRTSCPITGTIDAANAVATAAQGDFLVAYDQFAALPCDQVLTTLDAQTLVPGVYCFDAAATSTGGVLTLDGPATGLWIFKVGTLGTGALTGTNFSVVMSGGASPPCAGVYWWAAEGVTMTDSPFAGTILAGAAITLTGGTFNGDALAKAAVTVSGGAVTGCAVGSGGGGGTPTCTDKSGMTCKCKVKRDGHEKDDHGIGSHGKKSGSDEARSSRSDSHDNECAEDEDHDEHHDDHEEDGP